MGDVGQRPDMSVRDEPRVTELALRQWSGDAAGGPLLERPIFIVGDGRSGTTLLRTLLSAHSRLAITPETQYMARAEAAGSKEAAAPDDFDGFWQRYTSWVRFQDLDVDADRCLELVDLQGERTFKSIFVAALEAYRQRVGKERVGEKSPGHIAHLHRLFEWFPDALVIALRRDPRAVVASKMHAPWVTRTIAPPTLRRGVVSTSRLHAFVQQAGIWARTYEEVLPGWHGDRRVLTVSYEDLVQDPENQLQAICAFLGESYEGSMLTERSDATVPPSAGRAPDAKLERWRRGHEARSRAPVATDSLQKWQKELSSFEIALVEGRCAFGMRAAGYPFAMSPSWRLAGRWAARATPLLARAETTALSSLRRWFQPLRSVRRGLSAP